jgi:hypothetical protein
MSQSKHTQSALTSDFTVYTKKMRISCSVRRMIHIPAGKIQWEKVCPIFRLGVACYDRTGSGT